MAFVSQLFAAPASRFALLAAVLGPLPLCLGLCLFRRPRPLDLPEMLWTHLCGWFTLQGLAVGLLIGLRAVDLRSFFEAEAALFALGLIAFGPVARRFGGPAPVQPFAAGAALSYGAVLLTLCGFGLLAVSFGQDVNYDLFNYHYYNAYAFLENRLRLDFQPAGKESYLNPLLDLIYYFLINSVPPIWVGFITGAWHGAAIVLVFGIAYRVLGFAPGLARGRLVLAALCAAAAAREPVFLAELGTTFNDNVVGAFVLAALYIALGCLAAETPPGRRRTGFAAAGLLLGAGIGFKMAHAACGPALLLGLFVAVPRWRQKFLACGVCGAATVGGFLLTNGFWMVRLWARFHNPVFPYYNQIFRSPYLPHLPTHAGGGFPATWTEAFFYPFYFLEVQRRVMEVPFRDARLAIVYVLLAAALGVYVARRLLQRALAEEAFGPPVRAAGLLVAFVVTTYVLWEKLFCVYRYLLPVTAVAPVVAVLLCWYVLRRRWLVLAVGGVLCVGMAAWTKAPEYGHVNCWLPAYFPSPDLGLNPGQDGVVLVSSHNGEWISPFTALLRSFPKRMRFVRLDGPLMEFYLAPDRPVRMHEEVRALLEQPGPPVYLVCYRKGLDVARGLVRRYDLDLAGEPRTVLQSGVLDLVMYRAVRPPARVP
jgi:hypothetical protein